MKFQSLHLLKTQLKLQHGSNMCSDISFVSDKNQTTKAVQKVTNTSEYCKQTTALESFTMQCCSDSTDTTSCLFRIESIKNKFNTI